MPPSEGIPSSTFLLASNTPRVPRESARAQALYGASLVVPNSITRGQLLNPGRGPAFNPSRFIVGSEPVIYSSRNVRLWIPFWPIRARLYRRTSENNMVVGGVA
jgi:hypothetical protein